MNTALVIPTIDKISALANSMRSLPQVEAPVEHTFLNGVYIRKIFMPKGMVIVGKIHKTQHLNIISKGSCLVVTPTRKFKVTAPCAFTSYPGEQKVVYMLEDVVWATTHNTESTDLKVIEKSCIAKSYNNELLQQLTNCFGG